MIPFYPPSGITIDVTVTDAGMSLILNGGGSVTITNPVDRTRYYEYSNSSQTYLLTSLIRDIDLEVTKEDNQKSRKRAEQSRELKRNVMGPKASRWR
jgi:hypothetical protein